MDLCTMSETSLIYLFLGISFFHVKEYLFVYLMSIHYIILCVQGDTFSTSAKTYGPNLSLHLASTWSYEAPAEAPYVINVDSVTPNISSFFTHTVANVTRIGFPQRTIQSVTSAIQRRNTVHFCMWTDVSITLETWNKHQRSAGSTTPVLHN